MTALIPNRWLFVFGLKEQTEPFHLVHYLCLKSCLDVNRPEQILFLYHYEPYGRYWDLIKPALTLERIELDPFIQNYPYRDRIVRRYSYAHQADFVRLARLVEYGGVYSDMDMIFVNPLPSRLFEHLFVLGREEDVYDPRTGQSRPSLCNALIMSAAGAEFGRRWLDAMRMAFDGTWDGHSNRLAEALSRRYPALLHIEPRASFYKHSYTREGIRTLLEGCDPDTSDILAMHLWAHLWWERGRRDFSHFHAGRLTEDYIRNVDTTYNLVARRFLPAASGEAQRPKGWRRTLWGLMASLSKLRP
jgi:hypothetical protein